MTAPSEIYPVLSVLGAVLAGASVIGFVLRRRARDDKAKAIVENLNARIIAWWAIVFVAGGACLIGRRGLIILFAAISFFALREVMTVMPTQRADRNALLASFLLVLPVQYGLIWIGWYGLF